MTNKCFSVKKGAVVRNGLGECVNQQVMCWLLKRVKVDDKGKHDCLCKEFLRCDLKSPIHMGTWWSAWGKSDHCHSCKVRGNFKSTSKMEWNQPTTRPTDIIIPRSKLYNITTLTCSHQPEMGQYGESLKQVCRSVFKRLRNLVFSPWLDGDGSGLG